MPPRRRRRSLHACEPMTSAQQTALVRHCNDPLQWHVSGAARVPVLADDTTSFKSVKMVGSVSAITLSNLVNFGVAYGALRYRRGPEGRRMVPNGGVTGLAGSSWTNELVRRLRGVEWEQVADSNLCIRIAIPSDIVKWDLYAGSDEWNAQSQCFQLDLHISTLDRLAFVTFKLSHAPFGTLLGALIRLYHPHLFLAESQLELHDRPFGNRTEKITIALTSDPNALCSWIGLSWSSWTCGIRTKRDMWKCLAGLQPETPGGAWRGRIAADGRSGDQRETGKDAELGEAGDQGFQDVYVGGAARVVEGSTSLGDAVSKGSAIAEFARRPDGPKALDARELATVKFFGKEADLEDLIQERKAKLAVSLD